VGAKKSDQVGAGGRRRRSGKRGGRAGSFSLDKNDIYLQKEGGITLDKRIKNKN